MAAHTKSIFVSARHKHDGYFWSHTNAHINKTYAHKLNPINPHPQVRAQYPHTNQCKHPQAHECEYLCSAVHGENPVDRIQPRRMMVEWLRQKKIIEIKRNHKNHDTGTFSSQQEYEPNKHFFGRNG